MNLKFRSAKAAFLTFGSHSIRKTTVLRGPEIRIEFELNNTQEKERRKEEFVTFLMGKSEINNIMINLSAALNRFIVYSIATQKGISFCETVNRFSLPKVSLWWSWLVPCFSRSFFMILSLIYGRQNQKPRKYFSRSLLRALNFKIFCWFFLVISESNKNRFFLLMILSRHRKQNWLKMAIQASTTRIILRCLPKYI